MDGTMSTKLEGSVTLAPQRSQVAVVAVFLLVLAGFIASGLFLWHGKPFAWVPAAFTVMTFGCGLWMWSRSHRAEAEPTKITVTPDAFDLQTPAATFTDADTFQRVLGLVAAMGNRQDLPLADGLVSADLKPLPNSAAAAAERVAHANASAAALEHDAAQALTRRHPTYPVVLDAPTKGGAPGFV